MIQTVAYVGGIGLGVAGIFKLKSHVDNPGQTPMKDGLIRPWAAINRNLYWLCRILQRQ